MKKILTIEEIYKFYKKYPEHIGKLKAETRFGFKPILAAEITFNNSEVYEIKTKTGKFLRTSPDHKLLSNDLKWLKVKNLKKNKNFLFSKNGIEEIKYIKKLNYRDDLYDLQIDEVKEFYANNIVSHNSTIMETVFFGFTGKPYRSVVKNKLINTINKKNLVVELTLEHLGSIYLIRRGLKPNIFEIIKDSKKIEEDSNVRDYQAQLENMLGMDAKTFKQTIMMSSRYYKPFLDLKPQEKKEFIENIFSIKIFSVMTNILKKNISSTKMQLKDILSDIDKTESNIKILEDINKKQLELNDNQKADLEEEIKKLEEDIILFTDDTEILNLNRNNLNLKLEELKIKLKQKTKITEKLNSIKYKLSEYSSTISFFKNNDICNTCHQDIDSDFKENIISKSEEISELKEKDILILNNFLDKLEKINNESILILESISKINSEITRLFSNIENCKSNINSKKKSINKLDNIELVNQDDLVKYTTLLKKLNKKKITFNEHRKYLTLTVELISEKGIKKFILDKYIPILNTLLNKYLKKFDAPYSVMFNSEMEEEIIARGYEDLGYDSLSSGEKQRLDTALIFSFLELCKMKSSVSTNILFLDEVLDQSLDEDGITNILEIFQIMKQQNYSVFVISHREGIENSFDNVINVSKKKFSEIKLS